MKEWKRGWIISLGIMLGWVGLVPALCLAESNSEVEQLKQKVQEQDATIQRLTDRLARLESKLDGRAAPQPTRPQRVALESDELSALPTAQQAGTRVLERPWYQNIQLHGVGAAGFVWTGRDANRPHGGFLNHQAVLKLDAAVWEGVHYFQELQTVSRDEESENIVRLRQVYMRFPDLLQTLIGRESGLDTQIGRSFIPFGEDYLKQEAIDNPLVTLPAGFAYGVDEGLVFNGRVHGVQWAAGVMDGSDTIAVDDNADKFLSLKLSGNATDHLYLSASAFRTGESAKSAMEFGGSHLVPVGAGGLSSALGSSKSRAVDSYAYELDAKYTLGPDRYVSGQFGSIFIKDGNATFDRRLLYYQLEPKWNLGAAFHNKLYLVGRLSAIGTFNRRKGYALAGEPFASGDDKFGFDANALYRWAVGVGYWLNPRTLLKVEYSLDDFHVIESSPFDDGAEQRDLVGVLLAAQF